MAADELLAITYNLSFAVQKDWLFPIASEWWVVNEGRMKYGGDQHNFEIKPEEDRKFLEEWMISLCTKNAMEALAGIDVNGRSFDIMGLQECNEVERPKSFHADPAVWKDGFGFTSSALKYLDMLMCGDKSDPELSDFRDEPGLDPGSTKSRPNTIYFKQLTYVRTTLYGAGSIAAIVYNRETMGQHQRIAEGECETESALAANSILAGRPYLILYFPKRNLIFINIHAPRTEDGATGMQSYAKEQYQAVYDRLGEKILSLVESANPRVIVVADSNDELHIATEKWEAHKHEYIEMALGGERRLKLGMPGVRDDPKFEIPSRDGYLPRTAAWPTMTKVGEDKMVAKYDASGPKFSATIDLILDSWCDPTDTSYCASMGVPASMDYQVQYDLKRDPSEVAFVDARWDQMNKAHFTWMSDHLPMSLHARRL